ncbi:MAG: UvrD-helicase domain-containing protein, partial [Kiritimatiellaeota bacterium]|nr:UvrD-helicase domain-containing protein [Kiritimatiellota bacterium]
MKPELSNLPPAPLRHQAITASAGSGKTYQLAHRYLRLLVAGVAPERIAAMTFSRKAAGEIFDKIVGYLADYIGQPALGSERLAAPLTADDFTTLLRRLLEALPRLRIGTLDSFTVSLAGAFPLELGISPDLQLMDNDGAAAREAVREALDALFAAQTLDARAQDEFVELFKQATFGLEEKNIEQALQGLLDRGRAAWLAAPDPAAWGAADRIWGAPPAWLAQPPEGADVATAAADFLASLKEVPLGHKSARPSWEKLIAQARDFTPRSPPDAADKFLEKIGPAADPLATGQAVIKVYKELALSPAQCADLRTLLDHVLAIAIQRALTSTQGAGRFLALFERFYDERIRRRGRLTFGDLQVLLAPGNAFNGGVTLSRRRAAARLYIDYRLDGRLDHWLLDEFQDTSDQQWRVLENLADEILQDNSGERTFFLVGDVKQSIYGWRAGNPELFGRILAQYPNMTREHLAASRRSGPAVIAAVNQTFSGFDKLTAGGFGPSTELRTGDVPDLPEATRRRWADIWQAHTCAGAAGALPGYAALLDLPMTEDGKPEAEDRRRVLAALLQELDPVARGWSAAVLVRTNAQVKATCQYLRLHAPGLPVANEGVAAILDNPAVNVLIALARWAAHPGDTFAAQHLKMSPLAGHSALSTHDPSPITQHSALMTPALLLREIQEDGFQRFFRHWRAELERAQPLNAYEHRRLDELLIAAGVFDATRAREVNAFLRYMDDYQTHEPTAEAAVRVMTIHQA